MNPIYLKVLEELMEHMAHLKGKGMKSMMDSPIKPEGESLEEALEKPGEEFDEHGKPKGISIEKVELLGKKPDLSDELKSEAPMEGKEEPSDEELEELLKLCR